MACAFGVVLAGGTNYNWTCLQRKELLALAKSLLTLPTAPYHEQRVRGFVIDYCRALGMRPALDRVGNVVVRHRHRARQAPLVFVAHMDHPGFEALGGDRAEFLGGVPKESFAGSRVRFFGKDGLVRATVKRVDASRWPRRKLVTLQSDGSLHKGDVGMWDVPAFRLAGGKLHATGIDDVLGVAVVLATLAEVVRRKTRTHVWAIFTRAEEVGFPGAVAMARSRTIPCEAAVISMEMSRERPWARIGGGPVVRIGDYRTTFDPVVTYFLQETAGSIRRREATFRAQRCLMDGGTCEATAFAAFGYRVGGLCLPLGNYHNIGPGGRIRAEYVSVGDLEQLLQLTVAAAEQWKDVAAVRGRLRTRIGQILREAPRQLKER
jgi:endoglucanase